MTPVCCTDVRAVFGFTVCQEAKYSTALLFRDPDLQEHTATVLYLLEKVFNFKGESQKNQIWSLRAAFDFFLHPIKTLFSIQLDLKKSHRQHGYSHQRCL